MNPLYINVLLCDNDFGWELEEAATIFAKVMTQEFLVSQRRVKEVFIDLIVALANLKSAARGFESDQRRFRDYLGSKLWVEFSDVTHDADHDGGSVSIYRPPGLEPYIWRF